MLEKLCLQFMGLFDINPPLQAGVVELVDTHDSGSCARKGMGVRLSPSAPIKINRPES